MLVRRPELPWSWVLVGLVVGTLVILPASSASAIAGVPRTAAPGLGCYNHQWQVAGQDADPYRRDMSGVRGGVWFGTGHYCNRVTSITVFGTDDSSYDRQVFEFGWVIGYSSCTHRYFHRPTLFIYWSQIGDGVHCDVFPGRQPPVNTFHFLRAADANENSVWGARINGNGIRATAKNLDFHQGLGLGSTERSNGRDTAYGHLRTLDEHHTGNGWSPWDNARRASDNDPGFHFRRLGRDRFRVVHD